MPEPVKPVRPQESDSSSMMGSPTKIVARPKRLFYVIIQCIPIPLTIKFTNSSSIIIPILLENRV